MTEKRLYMCDICKTEYARPDDAHACEAYHVQPKLATKAVYKPRKMSNDPYPLKITIIMEDGQKVQYRR